MIAAYTKIKGRFHKFVPSENPDFLNTWSIIKRTEFILFTRRNEK